MGAKRTRKAKRESSKAGSEGARLWRGRFLALPFRAWSCFNSASMIWVLFLSFWAASVPEMPIALEVA
eukprot:518808-Amphidinium_carterae.1